MSRLVPMMVLLLARCGLCAEQEGPATTGECKAGPKRELSVSMGRKSLDEKDGRWMNSFSARRVDQAESSGDITLDAKHRRTECDGLAVIHIEAFVKEMDAGPREVSPGWRGLVFHPRHGKNAVILDNGRSVQKLDLDDPLNSVVFTNRPLKTNELFEVRLERRNGKSEHCLGVGIMTHLPENVKILPAMYTHSNGTWMYHNDGIYQNSKTLLAKYGHNLNKLQVLERVGVMRRDDGELHFFVNGVDQGGAASNVPENVYGIVELWYDSVKVKIIY